MAGHIHDICSLPDSPLRMEIRRRKRLVAINRRRARTATDRRDANFAALRGNEQKKKKKSIGRWLMGRRSNRDSGNYCHYNNRSKRYFLLIVTIKIRARTHVS